MKDEAVYTSPGGFLTIRKTPDNDGNGDYFYAERLGKDSISVVPYRKKGDRIEVLLHAEYVPPYHDFMWGAIGGSIDSDKPLAENARVELHDEVGLELNPERIEKVGEVFASTQSNEIVHLFIANATGVKQGEPLEPRHYTKWVTLSPLIFGVTQDQRLICTIAMMVYK